jgi:hypothetical protein
MSSSLGSMGWAALDIGGRAKIVTINKSQNLDLNMPVTFNRR